MKRMLHRFYWHLGNYRYVFYRSVLKACFQKKNSGIVLDAGCGEYASIRDYPIHHLVGIDRNKQNLLKSHAKRKGNYVLADLTYLPFKLDVFDTILLVDVLEHVQKKESCLKELSKVAKLGTRLIGSTTNLLNPLMMLDSLSIIPKQSLIKYIGKDHYDRDSRTTPKTLLYLLRQAGFNVHLSLFGFPPFQPWLYENSDRKLPWYAYIWILLDKLTNHFRSLKETMVFEAVKTFRTDSSLSLVYGDGF